MTRNALITSILSLLLCVSMLVSTTFAWFTDEVQTGMNTIAAGNLDVELYHTNAAVTEEQVTNTTKLFLDKEGKPIRWEPGVVSFENLRIANVGNLALNYQMTMVTGNENYIVETGAKLSQALKVGFVEGGITATERADVVAAVAAANWTTMADFLRTGSLLPVGQGESEKTWGVVIYWEPGDNDNQWNLNNGKTLSAGTELSIDLGIQLLATQKTFENDSFGPNYDLMAQGGFATDAAPAAGATKEYPIMPANTTTGTKVGTMTISSDSVADLEKDIEITVIPVELDEAVTVAADEKAQSFDITVTNLKDNNTTPIKVELNVGKGLSGVKVFHKGTEITGAVYNTATGYVVFETTSFSPYTVVYDAEPAAPSLPEEDYEGPAELPEGLPTATVTNVSAELANTALEWKSFGSIGAANPAQTLATVYKYEAADEDYDAKYDEWFCDFYVSVSQPIEEGQLFLGGEYGSYGWVGFDAPAVEANTEYALLASAIAGDLVTHGGDSDTSWRYADIKNFVGTFHCGVAESLSSDADLSGLTFTVNLCLTNPADATQYYNVHTITYTFQ